MTSMTVHIVKILPSKDDSEPKFVGSINDKSIAEFWAIMQDNFNLTLMDDNEVELVLGDQFMLAAPVCQCQKDTTEGATEARVAQDCAGDVFFVCGSRTCRMIVVAGTKPEADPTEMLKKSVNLKSCQNHVFSSKFHQIFNFS